MNGVEQNEPQIAYTAVAGHAALLIDAGGGDVILLVICMDVACMLKNPLKMLTRWPQSHFGAVENWISGWFSTKSGKLSTKPVVEFEAVKHGIREKSALDLTANYLFFTKVSQLTAVVYWNK